MNIFKPGMRLVPTIPFFHVQLSSKTTILKAMLSEAIFLATCNATMTAEKHFKLQRGCHTFAIFFRNLQRAHWELFTTLSPVASLKSPASKIRALIGSFSQNCVAGAIGISQAATCLATLRKVKDSSTFLATCKAKFCCIAGCKNAVLHVKSFFQLATHRLLRYKL